MNKKMHLLLENRVNRILLVQIGYKGTALPIFCVLGWGGVLGYGKKHALIPVNKICMCDPNSCR